MKSFVNEFSSNSIENDHKIDKIYNRIFKRGKRNRNQYGGSCKVNPRRKCIQSCCSLMNANKTNKIN